MSLTLKQLHRDTRDWRAANPLRSWRTHKARFGLTMAQVAFAINVSAQSVGNWELGRSRPSDSAMVWIAKLLKTKARTLEKEWSEWWSKKPKMI